jgi:hypothetical protein
MYYGMPAYLAMHRHGFYPHVFASPEQNLLVPRPALAAAPPMPRNYRMDKEHPPGTVDDPYSANRLAFYDYALVVKPKDWPSQPPQGLTPIASDADYTLFRIDKARYPRD